MAGVGFLVFLVYASPLKDSMNASDSSFFLENSIPHIPGEAVVIVIVVVVGLILITYLARVVKFTFSWKDLVSLVIDIKKDIKLPTSKGNAGENLAIQLDKSDLLYRFTNFVGKIMIVYGDDEETKAFQEFTLKALNNDVNFFRYFHSDTDVEIRPTRGFLENSKEFKRLRDFKSWDSIYSSGAFSNLHSVLLLVPFMKKGETKKLNLEFKLKLHLIKLVPPYDQREYFIFFRMAAECLKTVLYFYIPYENTASEIFKMNFLREFGTEILFEKEINKVDIKDKKSFDFGDENGNVAIAMNKSHLVVKWQIETKLRKGEICKLQWYVERGK